MQINKLLGCYRVVYNQCLERKKESYENNSLNENLASLGKFFYNNLLKDKKFSWLKEHNTKVLKNAIIDLLNAYKNFFEGRTNYPKFKSKHSNKQSCRFPIDAISKMNNY